MISKEIRRHFLDFFQSKSHYIERSAPIVYLASTMIWKKLVWMATTTPCLKCWATGLLETILKKKLSTGHGSSLRRYCTLIRKGCMPVYLPVIRPKTSIVTLKLRDIGQIIFLKTESFLDQKRIISGKWVTPALVDLALKSM